jgi:hypothetical protein
MIRIDGRSLGNGTAFSAVAPSQRPVCDAHQSKIFGERYSDHVPRARTPERLTSSSVVGSARTVVSISPIHIAQQCDLFVTYRRLSCLSASTICRCASDDVRTLIANQLGVDVKRVTDEGTALMIWGLTGSTAWN